MKARLALSCAVTCLALAGTAVASPSDAERVTARNLWLEGRGRMKTGDVEGALRAFRAADAIMNVPTTALDLARAQIALGMLVEGHESLYRALRFPITPDSPPPFQAAVQKARELLAELDPRIPSLIIRVRPHEPAPASDVAAITLDGLRVSPDALAVPHALNPGEHVIAIDIAGRHDERRVVLADGETHEEVVDLAPPEPPSPPRDEPAPLVILAPPPDVTTPPPPVAPRRSSARRIVITSTLVVGASAMVVGTAAGLFAWQTTQDLADRCRGHLCPSDTDAKRHFGQSVALVADGSFALAGAAFATAFAAWVWPRSPPTATTAAPFTVTVVGSTVQATVRF